MAFTFPDPITTPEFTAPNGFTYIYDQGQSLWRLKQKSMKLIPSTKTISTAELAPNPTSEQYANKVEKKSPDSGYHSRYGPKGFTWAGQNPETGRLIYYSSKGGWFGYSDDDGQTWSGDCTWKSFWKPGTNSYTNTMTTNAYAKNQRFPPIWCGGKQWILNGDTFGKLILTLDDFETVYYGMWRGEDRGWESYFYKSLKYDPVNDELWATFGDNKIVQFDSDLSWMLDLPWESVGPYNLLTYDAAGPDDGILFKKQIPLRNMYSSGVTSKFQQKYTFHDIAINPNNGTKILSHDLGHLVRSEDNFTTWEELSTTNYLNDPYIFRDGQTVHDIRPGDFFYAAHINYIPETDVWTLAGRESFQVSFDDGKSWVEIDYKTRATKMDVPFNPYVGSENNHSGPGPEKYRSYKYYPPFNQNMNSGYLNGNYYYFTEELGDPTWTNTRHYYTGNYSPQDDSPYQAWMKENVLYVSPDLKNWTRIPLGMDYGSESKNYVNMGRETSVISRQPGVDRLFLCSQGNFQSSPYNISYIDGFN